MANQTLKQLPFRFAKTHGVLIEDVVEDHISVLHTPNPSAKILSELQRALDLPLQLREIPETQFEELLAQAYETDTSKAMEMIIGMDESTDLHQLIHQMPKTQDLLETEGDAPIIRLINALFTQAIKQGASDIHIETFEDRVMVRFRIDGVLREILEPPRALAPLITSRIKVMARLNIAEKRLPQDGRITLRIAGRPVDIRVSTLPSSHGERIVMRLLDKQAARLNLTHLGMAKATLAITNKLIEKPHGILLVTGPTGSGKTTTLYAILTQLNKPTRNILTVEDPIEYYLPGIGQTPVNPKVDMTFARGLRSILRQDPDVVMVGEIRDLETAEIAVQASLTGHLVLSTLHTNSAIGAVTRLRDMGVEPFLLSTTLIGTASQRLVRVLCKQCKTTRPATPHECSQLKADKKQPPEIFDPVGCDECNHTGFQGRTGIYEVIAIDEKLRAMIHDNQSQPEMEKYAHTRSASMRQDGFRRVLAGDTTLEEVLRVTTEDI